MPPYYQIEFTLETAFELGRDQRNLVRASLSRPTNASTSSSEARRSNGIDKATPSDAPKQNPADVEDRKHQASRRQPWI